MTARKRILHAGRHLRLVERAGWEYVERTGVRGVVAVVAVTTEERLLLTEQYRLPVAARVIDLPAGLAGDISTKRRESLVAAARRELFEETGFRASRFKPLFAGPPSAGLSSEVISFFRATGLRRVGNGGGRGDECIQVHQIPLCTVRTWLAARSRRGVLVDPKVYAGLCFVTARGR